MVLWGLRIYGVILYIVLCWRLNVLWLYPTYKDLWGSEYASRSIVLFILIAVLTISHMFVDVKWKGDDLVDISKEDMVTRSFLTVIGLMMLIFLIDFNNIFSLLSPLFEELK